MTTASLDALLRRMSQMAENIFTRVGELEMIWLIELENGEQQTIVSPMKVPPDMSAGEYKEGFVANMRRFFQEKGVTRYARASECWVLESHVEQPMPDSISDHPDRREYVIVDADDGTEFLMAMREIVRPAGGKPYLTKLEIDRNSPTMGRFTDLLPSKKTRTQH